MSVGRYVPKTIQSQLWLKLIFVVVITAPVLGTFFPYETYLSSPSRANPLAIPTPPGLTTTITLILMYALALSLYFWDRAKMLPIVVKTWPLFLLVFWAITSAYWAEIPSLSFNRSGRLLITLLFGVYIAQTFDRKDIFRMLCIAALIAMACSMAVTVLKPSLSATMDVRGAYRGAFASKNQLGGIAALSMIVGFYSYKIGSISRWICAVIILFSLINLFLSNSITSILAMVIAMIVGIYLMFVMTGDGQRRVVALLVACLAVASGYFLLTSGLMPTEFAGRDSTLTGRTDVWRYAQIMTNTKPFWGWGHGAWAMPLFSNLTLQYLGWPCPYAHNTWLDFRLQLGVPGQVMLIVCIILAAWRSFIASMICRDKEYIVWISLIALQAFRANAETLFLDPAGAEMFWFAIAVTRLGMAIEASRATAALPSLRAPNFAPLPALPRWPVPASVRRPGL